jgi:hypothetical protein
MPAPEPQGWLLLIHQIPPKPNYFRVKIWRRLQRLGAVGIKSSVYALPAGDQPREDLGWVLREIVDGGGDASLVEARFVEGLDDDQVREMFRAARDAEYQAVADEARALAKRLPRGKRAAAERFQELEPALGRLRKRVGEIAAIDFFNARGREPLEGLLQELSERLSAPPTPTHMPPGGNPPPPKGGTWVTRSGIHIDRMASAWLIRRFIDPEARLKFVSARDYRHQRGEFRFDMFDGEFTHQGELCTFEVLLAHFQLSDPGLQPLGEMVHDIDLKDGKHGRPETPGLERMIHAIAAAHEADAQRLERAGAIFDDLYELFRRKRSRPGGP